MVASRTTVDYTKLRQDVTRAVGRLCPRWLANERDDLVQTAVVRVMRAVDAEPAGEGNALVASSYIYKAAYSVLVDEIRRVRRRSETDLAEGGAVEPVAPATADPERRAASREIGAGVVDCLTRLVKDRRLAVTLYLQGHTVPESARVLGWGAKRTENLVYRGLADLRECLRSKGLGR